MDFETFINKFSFVNSKFVKDFFNIIKEDYIERYNEFLIDSEILRKWLEIKNKQICLVYSIHIDKSNGKIICLLKQENERIGAMQVPGQ